MDGNTDQGPVLKVRVSTNQLIIGLVLHSQGKPKQLGQMGAASSPGGERLGRVVSKRDRDIHRLMDKPSRHRLAIKSAQCKQVIQGF